MCSMEYTKEDLACIVISREEPGSKERQNLMGLLDEGRLDEIIGAVERGWLAGFIRSLVEQEIVAVTIKSELYPKLLLKLGTPPVVLYCRGDLGLFKKQSVAIVGMRDCTRYGREVAEGFAREFASRGLVVVSGLAEGIDAAAHAGAFQAVQRANRESQTVLAENRLGQNKGKMAENASISSGSMRDIPLDTHEGGGDSDHVVRGVVDGLLGGRGVDGGVSGVNGGEFSRGGVVTAGMSDIIPGHECGVPTIAVLGNGVNVFYPKSNIGLQRRIGKEGLLVSEYLPNAVSTRYNFPYRNRIVAALSQAVVIVEADFKSGTMITRDWATELGVDVFAVPGPITSHASRGTNALIKEAACAIVTSVEDVLEHFGVVEKVVHEKKAKLVQLSFEEKTIMDALANGEVHFDVLVGVAGLQVGRLSTLLSNMEMAGLVTRLPGNLFASAVER